MSRPTKPFNFGPLVRATELLERMNNPEERPKFTTQVGRQQSSTIEEIDNEITSLQYRFEEEIQSISRSHQERRKQLLQNLAIIDNEHKTIVDNCTTRWTTRMDELYIERDAIVQQKFANERKRKMGWIPPTTSTADGQIISSSPRTTSYWGRNHYDNDEMASYNEIFGSMDPKNVMTFNPTYYPDLNVKEQYTNEIDPSCMTIFGYLGDEEEAETEMNIVSDAEEEEKAEMNIVSDAEEEE